MHRKTFKDQLIDDEYDRHEFIRQLDELRPHAEYFLFMLNDTRKQIRKSYISGDTTAAAKYYPIIRDLAKILILLNRPVELIDGPPHDWNRLLQWADRILVQFKPQQQITQLIEFLQSPTSSPELNDIHDDARLVSKHTTFKSLFYSTPVVQSRKKFNTTTTTTTTSSTSATLASSKAINTNKSNINRSSLSSDEDDDDDDDLSCCDKKHLSLPISTSQMAATSVTSVAESDSDKIPSGSLISLQEFIATTGITSSNSNSMKDIVNHSPSKSLTLKPNMSAQMKPQAFSKVYGDTFEHVKNYLSSGSLLVVDDELIEFKLGNRPQDEMVSEL
jgi:hypothetical protein